jgi:hypothetical protein
MDYGFRIVNFRLSLNIVSRLIGASYQDKNCLMCYFQKAIRADLFSEAGSTMLVLVGTRLFVEVGCNAPEETPMKLNRDKRLDTAPSDRATAEAQTTGTGD